MMDNAKEVARGRIRMLRPLRRRTDADRRHLRRGVYLLPSMFTMGSMFCGYACIVYSMRGEFVTAAPFIGFAIIVDMLDGRIARMTGTTSAFGIEFDSLADIISFGVAPAILAFSWGLQSLGRLGWAAGFIFVAAAGSCLPRCAGRAAGESPRRAGVWIPRLSVRGDGVASHPKASRSRRTGGRYRRCRDRRRGNRTVEPVGARLQTGPVGSRRPEGRPLHRLHR